MCPWSSVETGQKCSQVQGETTTTKNEMDVRVWKWRRLYFTLSQCGMPTLEMCGWCAAVFAREKCACWARPVRCPVYTSPSRSVSCVWLDAKRNFKKNRLAVRSWVSCRCQLRIGLFQDWEEEDEVGGSRSFAKYSAQVVLSHSGYSWSWGSSWFPKRCLSLFGTNGIPKSCRDCFCIATSAFFASRYPGLVDKGGACLSSSTLRRWSRLWYLILCSCGALWDISICAMWFKYLTQASDQPVANWDSLVGFVVLPSISDLLGGGSLAMSQGRVANSWVEHRHTDVGCSWYACRMRKELFLWERSVDMMGIEFCISVIQYVLRYPMSKTAWLDPWLNTIFSFSASMEWSVTSCAPVWSSLFFSPCFQGLGTCVSDVKCCCCCWLCQFVFNVTFGASLGVSSRSKSTRSPSWEVTRST